MELKGIEHRTVEVNGIRMHVAMKGDGPAVLLVHGFPELWYSWRHQIISLAASGYKAIAPDLRGYGDTNAPPEISSYSMLHLVGDLITLINTLGQDQVFVVGHDWGAIVSWNLCLFRPDKVKALVNLSVPFTPRNPAIKPVDYLRSIYGDDYYICKFQEPGAAEAEFARIETELLFKKFLTYRNPGPLFIRKDTDLGSPDDKIELPAWLQEEDIKYYASKFVKSGFTGGFNFYRCLNLNWELTAPWTESHINVPAKFVVGDLDLTYHYPGIQQFIHHGGLKKYVPSVEVVVMEGVGHFIHEEKPDEVTAHVLDFIRKF